MLDTAEDRFAAARTARRHTAAAPPDAGTRRDPAEDFVPGFDPDGNEGGSSMRSGGVRLTFRAGAVPRTLWGRFAAVAALLLAVGVCVAGGATVRSFLLHDDRFALSNSYSIEVTGNRHLTQPQLLSVFGEDLERNIFRVSLAERRAELEQLPWVEHATVMRFLPNRLRVSIAERTPVAFVRQGGHIGLVDRTGVLLDMSSEAPGNAQYSFPVVTGILAEDPLSVRTARMKILARFNADLDSSGENISAKLSEIDLSSPEDVKALIPDQVVSGMTGEILVHFGDDHFLDRYRRFEENLPKWRAEYPRLASADLRYERQVVLEMQAGTAVPMGTAVAANSAGTADALAAASKKPLLHALPVKPAPSVHAKAMVKLPPRTAGVPVARTSVQSVTPPSASTAIHSGSPHTILTHSFDVPRKPAAKPLAAGPVAGTHSVVPKSSNQTQAVPR